MTAWVIAALVGAGVLAGGLTTLAGLGGGVLLIAGLSALWPPAMVLGMTAPALFVGNATRGLVMLKEIAWQPLWKFSAAGIPCALAASLAASSCQPRLLKAAIALLLIAFLLDETFKRPRGTSHVAAQGWMAPVAGALAGIVSGLTGGAGFVAAPLLHRLGLKPTALVATSAAGMALIHLTKGVGFGLAQVLTPTTFAGSAALAVGMVIGNGLASKLLKRMPREVFTRLLMGSLFLASLQLAVAAGRG